MKTALNIGADRMVELAPPPAKAARGDSGKVHISLDYPKTDRDANKLDPRVVLYLRTQAVLKEVWSGVDGTIQTHLREITKVICSGMTSECLRQVADVRSGKIPSPFGNGNGQDQTEPATVPDGDENDQPDGEANASDEE